MKEKSAAQRKHTVYSGWPARQALQVLGSQTNWGQAQVLQACSIRRHHEDTVVKHLIERSCKAGLSKWKHEPLFFELDSFKS